jgi:hypothetical protein
MRMALEDRRQLLSGSAADFSSEQLRLNGPTKVTVPGLDGVLYRLNFKFAAPKRCSLRN